MTMMKIKMQNDIKRFAEQKSEMEDEKKVCATLDGSNKIKRGKRILK